MSDQDSSSSSDSKSSDHSEESEPTRETVNFADHTFEILVAGNINLGYEMKAKTDQEDDSFRTFEEILQHAVKHELDAILLTGNLFYETNPPISVLTKCMSLLRKYCFGKKPTKIECVTDPDWLFSNCFQKTVNFEDPNLNVTLPIFSIGGYRDTSIFSPVGSLDLLAAAGLINYFGKWTDESGSISVPPVLLRKGVSTAALYGLNFINDKKLCTMIKKNKLNFLRETSIDRLFNLLVVHQQRVKKNQQKDMFVTNDLIPDFMDVAVWGHEPGFYMDEPFEDTTRCNLGQPGSTIATSLTPGEASAKKFIVLTIFRDAYRMKCWSLETVRPFIYKRLIISEHESQIESLQKQTRIRKSRTQAIEELADNFINNVMLPEANKKQTGHPKQPIEPLIRLKIVYNNEERDCFKTLRLSKKYNKRVANPNDMISFFEHSGDVTELDSESEDYEDLSKYQFQNEKGNWKRTVQDGIDEYFNEGDNKKKLTVLTLNNLNAALKDCLNGDTKAFHKLVRKKMEKTVNYLMSNDLEFKDFKGFEDDD